MLDKSQVTEPAAIFWFSAPAQNAMLSHDQFADQEMAAHAEMEES
jgi:hypothetical protein